MGLAWFGDNPKKTKHLTHSPTKNFGIFLVDKLKNYSIFYHLRSL